MLLRIRFILPVLTLLTSLFTLHSSHAATIQLPRTGQTVCYDAAYNPIACTSTTGQDGNKLAGKPWPNPRFTINKLADGITEDGTVTDNLTGLIWLKDANCFGSQYWSTALTTSKSLASGFTCTWLSYPTLLDNSVAGDWRLPNIVELESLIDLSKQLPAALPAGHPFINFPPSSSVYWSSSTDAWYPQYAWSVIIGRGEVTNSGKNTSGYVWPVRGGQ